MQMIGFFTFAVAVLLGYDAPKDKGKLVEEEFAKLQGTWQQVSGRMGGEDLPADVIQSNYITIKGNKKSVHLNDQLIVEGIIIEIDPGATPRIWDEKPDNNSGKPSVIRGIYKLEWDTLTRCTAIADEPRPKAFASRPASGHNLQVFRRVKVGSGDQQSGAKER